MPISVTCPQCDQTYSLKEEFAGKKARCPDCQGVLSVPAREVFDADAESKYGVNGEAPHPAFQRDKFLMRQKILAISERYTISDEANQPILFAERPAHVARQVLAALGIVAGMLVFCGAAIAAGMYAASTTGDDLTGIAVGSVGMILAIVTTVFLAIVLPPKRHIGVYADESKHQLLMNISQDKKVQILSTTFTVFHPDGRALARIGKNQFSNLLRKKWRVADADGRPLFIAHEDSMILSLLRRFVPVVGKLIRTNFVFALPGENGGEHIRGEFNRKFTIADNYVLDLSRDLPPRRIDRRLAVAMGVLLDTGERR